MGLYVEDPGQIASFVERTEQLCKVRIIDYKNDIAFTGDIYINLHGLTADWAQEIGEFSAPTAPLRTTQ